MENENGEDTSYIQDCQSYDDTQADGFKVYEDANLAPNRWDGRKDTATIVARAKLVLEQYVGEGLLTDSEGHNIFDYLPAGRDHILPETPAELADLMVALGNIGGSARWRQLAYPAAYGCMLYEPQNNGKPIDDLDVHYKRGNWYLNGAADLMRLYIFFRNSRALTPSDTGTPTAEFSDEDNPLRPTEPTDARRPHYANLQKRAKDAGISCPISNPAQTGRWAATEGSSGNGWSCNFFYGGNFGGNGKYYGMRVRPVVAFPFVL